MFLDRRSNSNLIKPALSSQRNVQLSLINMNLFACVARVVDAPTKLKQKLLLQKTLHHFSFQKFTEKLLKYQNEMLVNIICLSVQLILIGSTQIVKRFLLSLVYRTLQTAASK